MTDTLASMRSRYFKNRAQAGLLIAGELLKYRNQNCAVVALSEGAIIVGAQIAMQLHAGLMLLLTEKIVLPGETDAIAALSSAGTYTQNNLFSAGQLEDFNSEYFNYIEGQRLEKFHRLNALAGKDGEIHRDQLRYHVVIIVADGLSTGFSLDVAADLLKPIHVKKIIVATPLATMTAIDRMRLLGDEVICLSLVEDYLDTNHYYEDNTVPDNDEVFKIIRNMPLNWSTSRSSLKPPNDTSKLKR